MSSAARRPHPGTGPGLGQLFLPGGQQPFDYRGELVDLGVDAAGTPEHGLEQGGDLGGEELRALQRGFQLGDLAAGPGAGQAGQDFGVALPGDEVVHDVAAGDAVQVGHHGRQLDRRRFQQLLRALLFPGALAGQVAPVASVQPDDPELRRGHKAGGGRAALEAGSQPPRIRRVALGPAGQLADLLGIGQHALKSLGLQPVKDRPPVVPGGLHHDRVDLPAAQPVRQRQHLILGGAEGADLLHPPPGILVRRDPDRRGHLGLADIDAAHPVPVQRLVGHLFHAPSLLRS